MHLLDTRLGFASVLLEPSDVATAINEYLSRNHPCLMSDGNIPRRIVLFAPSRIDDLSVPAFHVHLESIRPDLMEP